MKSFDLTAADGARIQVKVRLIRTGTSKAAVFSPIRSFDFDACLFVLVDNENNTVLTAREWTTNQVREHGWYRAHINGSVVRVAQLLGNTAIGADRTEEFDAAWQKLLAQRG